ncbi:MAG TPA: hypothetical protein VMU93_12190 [Caulobacteraceae bacterium]|nr:hypothetical protein [Caulobacteraceae bacterium]
MTPAVDIDTLLAAAKILAGAPVWVKDERGTVVKLAVPVAQSGVVGGLILQAGATLHTEPQRGAFVLVFEGRPIQRLSFKPDHGHANPPSRTIPQEFRGRRLPPGLSRMHHWSLNRIWPRPISDNVAVATLVHPEPSSLEAAVTIFLRACCIEGDLPPPPWEPRLL